jgi:hypothetical protein
MANRTVYVDGTTSGTPGTDGAHYTTFAAAISGEVGAAPNLVADSAILHIEISLTSADTAAVDINGFTTNASFYVRAYTAAAARHNGIWNTSKYRLIVTDANALTLSDEYIRIEGLQIQTVSPTAIRNTVLSIITTATSDLRLTGNLIRGNGNNTYQEFGLYTNDAACTMRIRNNVFFGFSNSNAVAIGCYGTAASVWYVSNNTAIVPTGSFGLRVSAGTCTSKNNLCSGGTCFSQPSGTLTNTNCASSDATADDFGGSGNRVSQTFTFVDAGSFDYHLASGDAGAKDFGTDLSGDTDMPFSDDIDGVTRTGTWDIGADEFVDAAPVLSWQSVTRVVQGPKGVVIYSGMTPPNRQE